MTGNCSEIDGRSDEDEERLSAKSSARDYSQRGKYRVSNEVESAMTIAEIIRATVDISPVQFIHECLTGAQDVKKKKDSPAHTRVTFVTEHMTCNDAFYWGSGGGNARKPKHVGIVVWIPLEAYEKATSTNAVDPSAQPQERGERA
jgi:hypothetical protein